MKSNNYVIIKKFIIKFFVATVLIKDNDIK